MPPAGPASALRAPDAPFDIVRLHAFWIDTWLRRNYEGVESRYIVHDVKAAEVDKKTFYSMKEDGGTRISSALACCKDMLDRHFAPQQWNTYLFHFSDGDNSSDADNKLRVKMLGEQLLPRCNMLGIARSLAPTASGVFWACCTKPSRPGWRTKPAPSS